MITQACGMQASLMSCALESYVVDNDMLGAIMSSLRPLPVDAASLSTTQIDRVARTEGHFLGEAETYAQMKTDFLYPEIADRRTPREWEDDGQPDVREVAKQRTREILKSHFPDHIDPSTDATLRNMFDIRLPEKSMKAEN